ncbi:MAG: hypothetical protein R3359_00580 [Marinirhabdus sp.]|nr:hypothetical protein [Marinirhabdus sp.]
MEEKDIIKDCFERHQGSFDIHELPEGHQKRFLEKLHEHAAVEKTPTRILLLKTLSIAATVSLLLYLGGVAVAQQQPQEADLASVSPEMEQTQSFFTTTISREIQALKTFESPETKKLIKDALVEITKLEQEYQQLKKDLVESGNNKRVIHAMISNFQTRITILEQVSETIESIQTLKNNRDETLL